MKKKFMVCAMLTMLLGMSLVSCNDDIDTSGGYVPGEYRYSLCVPNANDEMLVVLDSLSSPVKSIGTCPDWAVATVAESTADGHPVVRLVTKDCGPDVMNEGEIVILSERNDRVTLELTQSVYVAGNENTSDEFMTDWESETFVTIYSDRSHQLVPTPWADESITTLPENIRYDVKKKDGWEMAFSFLNKEGFDDCNYFALYNRYLGTLRIFLYVTNSVTTGSEYSFEVDMGSNIKKNKFPFYHALTYAIPSSHTSLPSTVNLLGEGINSQSTFKSFFSPYIAMSSTALSKGWTAFDIDASAYCPTDMNWLESGEQMQIACRTELNQTVSLAGNISANISGKYSSAEQTTSASSGVSSMLSTAGSIIGDVQNSALAAIEQQVTGSSLDMYCYYIGAACNVASFAYDYLMQNKYEEEAITDSMPGKIEMSLTGEIDLSGYIKSLTSNGISPITLKASTFKNTNANTNFGKGVWGLATAPVLYVVDDCLLGDVRRFSLTVNGDGSYNNTEAEDYHLRMVSFLDPTSIKLNINTEIFPDVSDVKVTCNYGVYPDVPKGFTSKYASLLGLQRPVVKISEAKANTIYKSGNKANRLRYIQASHTQFMSKVLEETASNCNVIEQAGSDYSYYGRQVNSEGKNFIISPQVYFPIRETENAIMLYDGEMPDFVVLVTVTFKSNGSTYIFSQRFLPEIKLIKGNEVKSKLQELKAYKTTCEQNGTVNYLQNNASVGVAHPSGAVCIQKTLDILEKITE